MMNIIELKSEEEWRRVYPLMHQLREQLDEEEYLNLVRDASLNENYHLFALCVENRAVSLAGFKPMTTLYYGKFIWVCDLVTDESERSKGYGKRLIQFVHTWSKKHRYFTVALSSGLQRKEAHRFYETKAGYARVSYVFKKILEK